MCEIARNSVLQSGWEHKIKQRWLGDDYDAPGPQGNDIHKTNVPNIRMTYRFQTLAEERLMVLSSLRKEDTGVVSEEGDRDRFGSLPGEPLLEHVKRSVPTYFSSSPKLKPKGFESEISEMTPLSEAAVKVPSVVISDHHHVSMSRSGSAGVSMLANRLAREGRITSLLDHGFEDEGDFDDDIWE